jgi:rhodanese-related sulfurtransferase
MVRYFEEDAALIVDARDAPEFLEGHIPGAVNLPYAEVISSPSLVESLETRGRPVIAYCGGEGCEVSLGVAEELTRAGFPRVAVYVGGFPEWVASGHPVEQGPVADRGAGR